MFIIHFKILIIIFLLLFLLFLLSQKTVEKYNNFNRKLTFNDIRNNKEIYLYCGDMPEQRRKFTNLPFIAMTLKKNPPKYHISHDITNKIRLNDNTVNIVQSQDVMEHIEYSKLREIINDIHRILKPNGLFRLSLPNYDTKILFKRSLKDSNNNIIFDKGGGSYDSKNKKVIGGGHVWFPTYKNVKELLNSTKFKKKNINFLHYTDNKLNVLKKIDYSKGYIERTPDHDKRVKNTKEALSIVVDCYK